MEHRAIEDLTLLQLILLFAKRPARNRKSWKSLLADPDRASSIVIDSSPDRRAIQNLPLPLRLFNLPRIQLLLFGIAVSLGLRGNTILRGAGNRSTPNGDELALGAPFLLLAIAIWLLAELIKRLFDVPGYIRSAITRNGPYRFRADRDLLFIFNPDVEEIAPTLKTRFPIGRELAVTAYDGTAYNLYRVPALGEASISMFLNEFG